MKHFYLVIHENGRYDVSFVSPSRQGLRQDDQLFRFPLSISFAELVSFLKKGKMKKTG